MRWLLSPATRTGLLLAALGVVGAAAWLASQWLSDRDDPAQVALGRTLYAAHCASCHGVKLEGQLDWQTPRPNGRMPAPPHDATGHTWHHSDQDLFLITKHGLSALVPGYQNDMPAFGGLLSDQEIQAILAFIKSTWPARERDHQEAQSRARP